eukprot:TRINITY_DN2430_c0_g1_i1.p1 TRINITY_DN2430_c0_g1~~TRINITY_DN2430_c0_g1_i1.p1  ORF type:complete len:468 (+),score=104.20 TRINITY_DN2430_c0_g1_i1:45-1448(+)
MIAQIFLAFFVLLAFYFISKNKKQEPNEPPMVKGGWPFIGHVIAFNRNPLQFLQNAKAECGDVFRIHLMGTTLTMVTSREYLSEYYTAPDTSLSINVIMDGPSKLVMGYPHQHLTTVFIAKAAAYNYDEMIEETVKEAIDEMPPTGQFNLFGWSRLVITQITFKMLMGATVPEDFATSILKFEDHAMSVIFAQGIVPSLYYNYILVPSAVKEREKLLDQLELFVKEKFEDGTALTKFFSVVQAHGLNHEGKPLVYRDYATILLGAAFAAITNSANGIGEALLHAFLLPSLSQKLIHSLEKNSTEEANVLAQAWCLESARLSTNCFSSTRGVTSEDFYLGKYHIPKGAIAMIAGEYLSTNHEFINPDEFNPWRFLKADKEDEKQGGGASNGDVGETKQLPNYPVLTWGSGPHVCPGKKFALAEMKGALRVVLSRLQCKVENKPTSRAGFQAGAIVRRADNILVTYQKK